MKPTTTQSQMASLCLLGRFLMISLMAGVSVRAYGERMETPKLVGAYGPPGAGWRSGDTLLRANGVILQAIDLSGPAPHRPLFQMVFQDWIDDAKIISNALCLALHSGELKFFDITDMARPVERTTLLWDSELGGTEFQFAAVNDSVCVWSRSPHQKYNDDGGAIFLDVRDPWHPRRIDSIQSDREIYWVHGDHLYLLKGEENSGSGERYYEAKVYETGEDKASALISTLRIPLGPDAPWHEVMAWQDPSMFIWNTEKVWEIRDVEGGAPELSQIAERPGPGFGQPFPIGGGERVAEYSPEETTIHEPSDLRDVAVAGDWAYLADAVAGLIILNISNPARPEFAGACPFKGEPRRITLGSGKVYVAAGEAGMHLINVADPTSPKLLSTTPLKGDAQSIAVRDHYAFVASTGDGLAIFDVSNEAHPRRLPWSGLPKDCYDIMFNGDHAYVAGSDFTTFDIKDVENPIIILPQLPEEEISPWKRMTGLGNTLHLWEGIGSPVIMDVSDPARPRPNDVELEGDGYFQDAYIKENYLIANYMQWGSGGTFNSINIYSLPEKQGDAPFLECQVDLNWLRYSRSEPRVYASCSAPGVIYLAAGDQGLLIIKDEYTTSW